MSFDQPVTADEKRWQAESDARTLSQGTIIKADENRMAAAKKAADRLAEEEQEQAEALKKVASGKVSSDPKVRKMFPNTRD